MPTEHTTASQGVPHPDSAAAESRVTPTPPASFLEHFLDSFFQEKNIRWMLVVGAGIVFGSSLMLVNQAWEGWSPELRFLTILSYTGLIFAAAEVSRLRLNLTSTWKVLHSLTLMLLPICFLAVQWLTSGSGTQPSIAVFGSLFLLASSLMWFAGSRILDHLLRGRQSTFLISYCLLSVAGAVPSINHPALAFGFLAVTWVIFSAGVLKVNRHTFWLAEEHRLPRIFGFLPIAMLGVMFVVVVSAKALSAIPMQWIGFACVMAATTVLLTARTVADVFRHRTGDLVRPLPATIVIPTFVGLVLTALGMALAFTGFSYTGTTTYAIIPTSLAAAALMYLSAKDTRHPGFMWASLICIAVTWQCSPVLFTETVQYLKQSAATAINRERVPLSMYGVTWLPLLGGLAGWCRHLMKSGETELACPVRHFVTTVAMVLFGVAFTDGISLFIVSAVYVVAFLILAVLFSDRCYVLLSLAALVIATGTAVPALQSMQYLNPGDTIAWAMTCLSALAAVLTATGLPDRLVNRIPVSLNSVLLHRDPSTQGILPYSLLLQTSDGHNRCIVRATGGILAGMLTTTWLGSLLAHFNAPFTQPLLLQSAFLMSAFVLYSLRRPRYMAGAAVWVMIAFVIVRWAAGTGYSAVDILQAGSLAAIGSSLLSMIGLGLSRQLSRNSLTELRRELGFYDTAATAFGATEENDGGWMRQIQAFVVPLCDLSLATLSCLAVAIHLPLLLAANLRAWEIFDTAGQIWFSTSATFVWLAVAAGLLRQRSIAGLVTLAAPLWITAHLVSWHTTISGHWLPVIWAAVQTCVCVLSSRMISTSDSTSDSHSTATDSGVAEDMFRISEVWLQGILLLSCLSLAPLSRIASGLCLACFVFVDRRHLDASRRGYLAVLTNIQLLLLAAAVGGARGDLWNVLTNSSMHLLHPVPLVFLTSIISVLVFRRLHHVLEPALISSWVGVLRAISFLLGMIAFAISFSPVNQAILLVGIGLAAAIETGSAVRKQREIDVWTSLFILTIGGLQLSNWGYISFGVPTLFVMLGISAVAHSVVYASGTRPRLQVLRRPLLVIAHSAPMLVVLISISGAAVTGGLNALIVLMAAGIYFQQAMVTRQRKFAITAAVITNVGLTLLFSSMGLKAWEFYLVPAGLSVLVFVELLKKELPASLHDPLRYLGALTILVSPMFEVLDGDLAHMLTLLLLCVLVMLLAIGLRIRVLVYTASAFLAVDVVAMVFHTTRANPALLWVGGLLVGVAVIALAAVCENHREKLLIRVRRLSAELATWN